MWGANCATRRNDSFFLASKRKNHFALYISRFSSADKPLPSAPFHSRPLPSPRRRSNRNSSSSRFHTLFTPAVTLYSSRKYGHSTCRTSRFFQPPPLLEIENCPFCSSVGERERSWEDEETEGSAVRERSGTSAVPQSATARPATSDREKGKRRESFLKVISLSLPHSLTLAALLLASPRLSSPSPRPLLATPRQGDKGEEGPGGRRRERRASRVHMRVAAPCSLAAGFGRLIGSTSSNPSRGCLHHLSSSLVLTTHLFLINPSCFSLPPIQLYTPIQRKV